MYAKESIGPNYFTTRLKAPETLEQVLALPRSARVKASSSAWWAAPGPLQPANVGAGMPYHSWYDPVASFNGGGGGGGEEEGWGADGGGGAAEGGGGAEEAEAGAAPPA